MGIGYKDAVVLYNRHYNDTLETEYYFGTLFENVRIELTQAENINKSGMKDADSFLVKIPNDGTLFQSTLLQEERPRVSQQQFAS